MEADAHRPIWKTLSAFAIIYFVWGSTFLAALPPSKVMSSGAQMLAGGVLLALTAAALGEFGNFHPGIVSRGAWLSLLYLIVPGSIIGFTAYVWLIHRESPTKVGTYAYVNPVVAVLLGYFLAGEELGLRTILGTMFVLISVVVITMTRAKSSPLASADNMMHNRARADDPRPTSSALPQQGSS